MLILIKTAIDTRQAAGRCIYRESEERREGVKRGESTPKCNAAQLMHFVQRMQREREEQREAKQSGWEDI